MNGEMEEDEEEEKLMQEINTLGYEITQLFANSKKDINVCMYTLVRLLVMSTHHVNIPKPHLLSMISEEWEALDEELERRKGGNNN